ncbi:polyketide synthase [Pseudobacteriovorax antillogorgiicola]|uniref:Amino acid adenylation domain-containing protein n=1 Tax=Pseudobacteriovorax antillogorgiicola TaxID=1513793 RepID=A0A1Y6BIC1_9BACT|nr:polyketide synthase [Pseudobacteriovorax antillogorgiicola]TCS55382.1 amino acid adenylation domain-containing protein [Pseudobacteriovorax antillogorgiicola]SMF13222.1 amino acid adenylation domain-containing protein [Pseudobacteriovorax antillogorgiicola]
MKLKPMTFGKFNHLVGVLSEPATIDPLKPLVLTWNAGMSSRLGLHQINREIGHRLANLGYSSARFDLSGQGDSGPRQDGLLGQERCTADIRETMDHLESLGYHSFILAGNCSSAVDAHHATVADKRVVGLAMIDSYCYPTQKFKALYYTQRLKDPKRWAKLLAGKNQGSLSAETTPDSIFETEYPPQDQVHQELQGLVRRGVSLFVCYTGGFQDVYNYEDQFFHMFPDPTIKEHTKLQYLPKSDHMLTLLDHRQAYLDQLVQWIEAMNRSPETLLDLELRWQRSNLNTEALILGDQSYTYRHLLTMSERIATYLMEKGIKPGDRVGIHLERSPACIFAILGVLKAGACYVPLDPSYPIERLRYMAEQAQLKGLLSSSKDSDIPAPNFPIEEALATPSQDFRTVPVSKGDPAYIIYTSGSTGKPKGVVLSHSALTKLILWQNKQSTQSRRTLQFSPISFDVSFQEIFSTFSSLGTLVLINERDRVNPKKLLEIIDQHQVDRLFLPFVALQMICHTANHDRHWPQSLKEVITAGEQLQINDKVRRFFEHLADATLTNQYGPSESHVVTSLELNGNPEHWPPLPSIGSEVDSAKLFLVQNGEEVEAGHEGEIYISGDCLASGYWNRPDATDEKFISWQGQRCYRTGDLGKRLSDGTIAFLGRNDHQVKIRGHRIELGDVEVALSQEPRLDEVVVVASKIQDQLSLIACFTSSEEISEQDLRDQLRKTLPEYMVPSRIKRIPKIPKTPSGKIDRKVIPKLIEEAKPKPPENTELQSLIAKIQKVCSDLIGESISPDASFFDHGGNSLLAIQAAERLQDQYGVTVSPMDIFDQPSPRGLAKRLEGEILVSDGLVSPSQPREPIAIIGMACRFPGANNIHEFWHKLTSGAELGTTLNRDDLPQDQQQLFESEDFVPRKGIVDGADNFDHEYFNLSVRDAELMDPQHRVLMEESVRAMSDANLFNTSKRNVGVFAGCAHNTYFIHQVLKSKKTMDRVGHFQAMLANDKDYLASRIAYHLNLKGPAISINTACSTSLVALGQAVDSLRAGRCEAALVGGSHISIPLASGYEYQEGDIRSPDGLCRPFDKNAQGTYFSDGVAAIVIMPLSKALKEGHRIYSVIEGIGLNNDGGDKASFSSPSIQGQVASIKQAQADARLGNQSIDYIECHGTATLIGDPIEIKALAEAYPAANGEQIALGSVKSNFGHLTAAAGLAGLIKTSLSLFFEYRPQTLHFSEGNPHVPWDSVPFVVQSKGQVWSRGEKRRRAAISSFGIGGTNAHVIIAEGQVANRHENLSLLCYIADSQLDEGIKHSWSSIPMSSGYFSFETPSAEGRGYKIKHKDFELERFISPSRSQHVSFLLPGQGSQASCMGQSLAKDWPRFAKYFQDCLERFDELLPQPLSKALETEQIHQTQFTQAAIFSVSYSLGKALLDLGVQPNLMIGHSIGEISAAALSQHLSLADATNLVAARGRLMQALPSGGMLAVRAPWSHVQKLIPESLDLAAINGTDSIVVAGPHEDLDRAVSTLETNSIKTRLLKTSHAFHSRMMNSMRVKFESAIRIISLKPALISVKSTLDGRDWLEQQPDLDYWLDHVTAPVNFYNGVQAIPNGSLVIELGAGRVTANLAKKSATHDLQVITSMGNYAGSDQESTDIWTLLAELWIHGLIEKSTLETELGTTKKALPYPFQSRRCWIEADDPSGLQATAITSSSENRGSHGPLAPGNLNEILAAQLDLMSAQLNLLRSQDQSDSNPPGEETGTNSLGLESSASKPWLGRCPEGYPAYFQENPEKPGQLLMQRIKPKTTI